MGVKDKILIISFKYPPYPEVGGNRWGNLSMNLAKLGYEVHVVTVDWGKWIPTYPNLFLYRTKSYGFHRLKYSTFKNRYLNGVKNRILNNVLMRFHTIDEAQFWGYDLIPKCKRIIDEKKVKIVIATGKPFMANYWAARLKEQRPKIKLIQDFRDPWTDDPFCRWHSLQKAHDYEKYSVESADLMLTVTVGLQKMFMSKTENKPRAHVLRNGYELKINESLTSKRPRPFEMIHIGSISFGREEPLDLLLNCAESLKDEIPELRIKLVGNIATRKILNKFPNLVRENRLVVHKHVPVEKAQEMVSNSFIALQLNAKAYPYLVSTKIYEYAALRRPVLSINYGNELDQLIKTHEIGYSVNAENPEETKNAVRKLYSLWKVNPEYIHSPLNIEIFSHENLAKELASLFGSL